MTPHPPPPPHPPDRPSHNPKGPPKKKSLKALVLGFIIGTFIAFVIGGILWVSDIPTVVVLPVLAIVCVGSISLFYSVLKDK